MSNSVENSATILPGLKPVLEALAEKPESIVEICCARDGRRPEFRQLQDLCEKRNIPLKFVDNNALDELCATSGRPGAPVSHQGVVARITDKEFCSLDELFAGISSAPLPLILALDQVQDSGNLGALARTLYALGGAGVILPKHNSAMPGPAAMRASAGALRNLPIARVTNLARALDSAEEFGLAIYGTGSHPTARQSLNQCLNIYESPAILPAVIVLGNENKGIRPEVAKRCIQFLTIPMARKFDSLNVAQTGAILLGLCAARHYNISE